MTSLYVICDFPPPLPIKNPGYTYATATVVYRTLTVIIRLEITSLLAPDDDKLINPRIRNDLFMIFPPSYIRVRYS